MPTAEKVLLSHMALTWNRRYLDCQSNRWQVALLLAVRFWTCEPTTLTIAHFRLFVTAVVYTESCPPTTIATTTTVTRVFRNQTPAGVAPSAFATIHAHHHAIRKKTHTTTHNNLLPSFTQAWQKCAVDPIFRFVVLVRTSVTWMFGFILLPKIFWPFGTCTSEPGRID